MKMFPLSGLYHKAVDFLYGRNLRGDSHLPDFKGFMDGGWKINGKLEERGGSPCAD